MMSPIESAGGIFHIYTCGFYIYTCGFQIYTCGVSHEVDLFDCDNTK